MKNRKLNERCSRCGKSARMEGTEYCGQCLCTVIEKRAKKELAGDRGNSNRDCHRLAVVCGNKSSLQCAAAAYLVKRLCRPGLNFEIALESTSQMPKNSAENSAVTVIMAKCADELATEFVETLISGETREARQQLQVSGPLQEPMNAANIFKSITEKELKLYANIKNLKYAEANGSWLRQKVLKLHETYPGTIEALARAGSRVRKLIDK